ncbi:MAG: acyl-CoA carboxylase subunit epsilon [Corynebacteriales bacterium]|nr:acyl-CoA carboxylase subunit epsilon [Mycobacteriales bacterium]
MIRVDKGNPTFEELAALVVVLSSRQVEPAPEPVPASRWGAPSLRAPMQHGYGAWRASALPYSR